MARAIGNRDGEEENGNDGSMTQLRTMPQGAKRRGQTILQTHVSTLTHMHTSAKVQACSTEKEKAKYNEPRPVEVHQRQTEPSMTLRLSYTQYEAVTGRSEAFCDLHSPC